MGAFQAELAIASQGVNGGRSFQLLTEHDCQKLEAFFLAMSFDQRRSCFGGGMSDEAVIELLPDDRLATRACHRPDGAVLPGSHRDRSVRSATRPTPPSFRSSARWIAIDRQSSGH